MKKISNFINLVKKIDTIIVLVILIIFLTYLLSIVNLQLDATKNVSNFAAKGIGEFVGKAIGSTQAIIDLPETIESAKEEGISGEDVNTSLLIDEIKNIGILEVLSTEVSIHQVYRYGGKSEKIEDNNNKIQADNKTTYAALYIWKANGIFTVDLSNLNISNDSNTIMIKKPNLKLIYDPKGKEKLNEYGKPSFNVKDSDYLIGYLNSEKNAIQAAKEKIANYDLLVEESMESAEKTISFLINSLNEENVNYSYNWVGEVTIDEH